jgi:hypothetical protein
MFDELETEFKAEQPSAKRISLKAVLSNRLGSSPSVVGCSARGRV